MQSVESENETSDNSVSYCYKDPLYLPKYRGVEYGLEVGTNAYYNSTTVILTGLTRPSSIITVAWSHHQLRRSDLTRYVAHALEHLIKRSKTPHTFDSHDHHSPSQQTWADFRRHCLNSS